MQPQNYLLFAGALFTEEAHVCSDASFADYVDFGHLSVCHTMILGLKQVRFIALIQLGLVMPRMKPLVRKKLVSMRCV